MSPIDKASHKVKTSKTRACLLVTTVWFVVAATITLAIIAALPVSQADTSGNLTSPSVGNASLAQTPTPTPRRRRPIVVNQIPTPSQTNDQQASTCPSIAMRCPGPVSEGTEVTYAAQLKGGTRGIEPRYVWTVSAGKIIKGQDTPTMTLSTAGAGGKSIIVALELVGFGRRCIRRCSFRVDKPKEDIIVPVTPTPATPTPTVKITPTPTVTRTVAPSPTATPTPTISYAHA